jgi:hypothetical protein
MPAFQSVPEFDLSEKYHLKAVGCEKCAVHASDQSTRTGMARTCGAMAFDGGSNRQDARRRLAARL